MSEALAQDAPAGSSAVDALEHAVATADWPSTVQVVRDAWFELVKPAHADRSREVFARIPGAVLRREPLLAMEYGILLNQTRFQRFRALRYFVAAVRAARTRSDDDLTRTDRFLIRTSESAAFRLLGRSGASVAAARAALDLAAAFSDDERESLSELPRMYSVIGTSFFYGGQSNDALRAAALGLAESSAVPPSNGMGALALLCGIHTLRGDLPEAREYLEYARTGPWTDRDRNAYSGVLYRVAESYTALERFDAEAAAEHLEQLWAMSAGQHSNEHWLILAETQALIELVSGRPGRGLAALDSFVELRGADGSSRARTRLARIHALLQLALNNPDGASAVLERDRPDEVALHTERARIALTLGQTGTALTELRALAGSHLSSRQAAEAAALDAAVLLRLSPTPRREGAIQRLGSLIERSEQRLALALLPPADLQRVRDALVEAGFPLAPEGERIPSLLPDLEPGALLSRRELAVLEALTHTASLSHIATTLVVSTNTVKTQLRAVYRKLGVTNREDALAVAAERHLLREAQE
jgi:ATP/maltotriose-dependent transcriptional regulator MalT